jgi:transcription elongation GreA/GreB family factor
MGAKQILKDELLRLVTSQRDAMRAAQKTTAEAATHPEAKPENSKDTRALEQSYLARGQAGRLADLESAVIAIERMPLRDLPEGAPIGLGAQIEICELGPPDTTRRLWIAPGGGGERIAFGTVDVITPASPLGRALLGRTAGEVVEYAIAGKPRELRIDGIR